VEVDFVIMVSLKVALPVVKHQGGGPV